MSVYEIVTTKILEQMEKGIIPWQRPWSTQGRAINYVTRKEYRGINRLLLTAGEFLTFKQVQELGGHIKAGSKAYMVVFWKTNWISKQEDEDGNEVTTLHEAPVLRYYNVFSLADVEGIPSKLAPVVEYPTDPIPVAETVFDNYISRENITLQHSDLNHAYYSPIQDLINLPQINQFKEAEKYYGTAFHESAHSTGHSSRLKRIDKVSRFGSQSYSKEELVAEMAAAFVCGSIGIDSSALVENTAAYLENWSNVLKQDPKLVVLSAGAAEKAADYILNGRPEVAQAI